MPYQKINKKGSMLAFRCETNNKDRLEAKAKELGISLTQLLEEAVFLILTIPYEILNKAHNESELAKEKAFLQCLRDK